MVMKKRMDLFASGEKAIDVDNKIITDPQGSYTGRPADPYEIPVQDADDL